MITLPHLETNVTAACQNRCVACNHFVPLEVSRFKASMIAPEDLARDLQNFGRVAHVHGYALIGGEPLMHPEIVALMRVAEESGIADRVELWTNGQALDDMARDFWDVLDVLVLSVYPGKLDDADIERIDERCREAGAELIVKDERQTPNFSRLLEPMPTSRAVTEEKFRRCFFKGYSRVLDRGYLFLCCTSPFIPRLLLGEPFGTDGLRVDEHLTERALHEFLSRSEPLRSCGICAGRDGRGDPMEWREVRDPDEWVQTSAGAAA